MHNALESEGPSAGIPTRDHWPPCPEPCLALAIMIAAQSKSGVFPDDANRIGM